MRIKKIYVNLLKSSTIKQLSLPTNSSLVRIIFLFLVLNVFASCKDESLTDADIQPEADKLNLSYASYSGITSFIQTEDSNRSDETPYNLLGSYLDPIFGKCEAGFMSQFYLSGLAPNFTHNGFAPKIDSIVLSMAYHSYYGDVGKSNGIQKVAVYELTKDIYADSLYYSNKKVNDYFDASKPIATKTFWPQLNTVVKVGSSFQVPQLRIKLDTAMFGRKIMGLNSGEAANLSTQELFLKFFKGLYLKTENTFHNENQGAILYFDMNNSASKITTYYHTDTTASFDYVVSSSSSARINLFQHNYVSAPKIQNQLSDPSLGQQEIYVQAMAGLRSNIKIPLLKQLIDSGPIAIYKAELIFKINEPFIGKYVPNNNLFLFGIDSIGGKVFLPDQSETNFSGNYYGGTYDATNKRYKFNIARYVQLVATKKIVDNGLYLVTGSTFQTANRVVLKGGNNIQLNLTYTKL